MQTTIKNNKTNPQNTKIMENLTYTIKVWVENPHCRQAIAKLSFMPSDLMLDQMAKEYAEDKICCVLSIEVVKRGNIVKSIEF